MKLAHLGDIHIKNLKYHDIYENVFRQLYTKLEEEKVDKIILCGDIAHTKTNISPEFVQIAGRFFSELANIAPLYIILGNHDGNLKNADRQDAITPIVEALNNRDIHLLKKSGEVHLDDKFALNVLSIFDRDNWIKPTNSDKINIALYHGAIEGSKTDIGWVMKDTDDNISIFNDFDFAFLGDIHKRQFLKKNVAYCGSLIQQNFGEETDKGILIWDISDKEDFKVKKIDFENQNPFLTVDYQDSDLEVPSNAYVRLILDKYYSQDQIEKIKEQVNEKCSPKSIIVVNKHANQVENTVGQNNLVKLNLRDNNVQQNLIKEFLENEELSEDMLEQVLEINTKYNLEAEISDDVARNVKWSIDSFKWDNLFNYKEKNEMALSELSGIVGIFGKNYSGKSSIIDGLLYTLFNTTSKKIRKNFDVINDRKNFGSGEVTINVGDNKLLVSRETEKNVKKSKGKLVEEGKTNVNFEFNNGEESFSLNGNDRNETDKNIRKEIGSYEDFCNTSLSTQHGSLDFINEGSTKRKEILANFLDLQIFEKKHKPANQYANELKALIKKLQVKDHLKILDDLRIKEQIARNNLEDSKKEVVSLKEKNELLQEQINKLNNDLSKVEEIIDIKNIHDQIQKFESQLTLNRIEIENKSNDLRNNEETAKKIETVIGKLNVEELKTKQEASKKLLKQIDEILQEKRNKNTSLTVFKKSSELIDMAACGEEQFTECPFKKSAIDSLKEISIVELALKSLEEREETLRGDLLKLEPEKVSEYLDKFSKLKDKSVETSNKISGLLKDITILQNAKFKLENDSKAVKEVATRYESNKNLYDNVNELRIKKDNLTKEKSSNAENLKKAENDYTDSIADLSAVEQKINNHEEQQEELDKLNKEYSAYELFLKCVHNSGIPFELIKKTLPILNEEINKLLQNIVEFEAYFAEEDGRLEIYIQHEGMNPRSIENCSGSEKSLVAMAIRMSLIKCGSLPTSDIFILDEPATSLDAEHLESFIKLLEMIKSQFKTVLLITHLDTLKDSVDKIIEIQKDEEGFAYIN